MMLLRLERSSRLLRLASRGTQRQSVSRVNTEALKYTAQGVGALVEVDRMLPYTNANDARLQPLLKRAKENFEMALEVESSNTDAMLFLSRLYMYYHIPGTSPASGAALLEAAADAGNSVAQYELACRLRAEGRILGVGRNGDGMDEKAFKYLEMAACKKHPEALFLMGSIYLAGEHVECDVKAASWCFRTAAEQGHIAAATVLGAIVATGRMPGHKEPPEQCSALHTSGVSSVGDETLEDGTLEDGTLEDGTLEDGTLEDGAHIQNRMVHSARYYFEIAAQAGDTLALEWLDRMGEGASSSPAVKNDVSKEHLD